jgi:hypothetical protein
MKFPVLTALTAVAMLGALGGAARADDEAKLKTDFSKRLFSGEVVKGKTSYACFVRRYDAAHLAKHPKQTVATMQLLVKAEIDNESGQINHSFRMGVSFRDRPGKFDTAGECGNADVSEMPGKPPHLGCGVDCDGGGITVELTPDATSTLVRLERIAIWNNSKPDGEDNRDGLTAGADDGVFRLDRAALSQCKPLMPTDDKQATLAPK